MIVGSQEYLYYQEQNPIFSLGSTHGKLGFCNSRKENISTEE
jgi:hypothetical protein